MTKQLLLPDATTRFVGGPDGRVAYDVDGAGPLVVLVPGMGDLRQAYRYLAPALRQAGYRVAASDLRGHGDSDTTFAAYGDVETAGDVIALIEELGGPAVVVGNSKAYLPKLYAGTRPADFDDYRAQVVAGIRRPGHARAFSLTTRSSHAPAEARVGDVSAPALVVMGESDPDFADPRAEADWLAGTLHGQVVMVADAGHYPQSQRPDVTGPAVVHFVDTVTGRA